MTNICTDLDEKEFAPGTTGWTAADLDDPEIERKWFAGKYEIVEGVLAHRPPSTFDEGAALSGLVRSIEDHLDEKNRGLAFGVDFVAAPLRVAVSDALLLSPADQAKQKAAHADGGKQTYLKYGRIVVPPTLIIEAVSPGHEAHDRVTKRRWYAEAKVPNYWLLDAMQRSLECLVLDGNDYRVDQVGQESDELRPSMFPGLVIPLARLWVE